MYRQVDGGPLIFVDEEDEPETNSSMTDTQAPMYYGDGNGGKQRLVDYIVQLWDTVPSKIDEKVSPEDVTDACWYLCPTPE